MKKYFYTLLALLLMLPVTVFGASGDKLSFQADPGTTESGYTIGADIYRIDAAGRLVEAANETTRGMISFALTSFTQKGNQLEATGTESTIYISEDEARLSLIRDTQNNPKSEGNTVIVIPARSLLPIERTFRVPPDYYQNGTFRVKTTSSENTHAAAVRFAVKVHTDSAIATTFTIESDVALPVSASTATIAELTLTPTSGFSALAADNWVTIKLQRTPKYASGSGASGGMSGGGDNDLNIYNFAFRYDRQY